VAIVEEARMSRWRRPHHPGPRPAASKARLVSLACSRPVGLALAASVAVGLVVTPGGAQPPRGKPPAEAVPGVAGPLPAARAHAVKADPSRAGRVYTATPQGLYVSQDRGRTWSPLAVDGGHDEVFSVAVDPADPDRIVVGRRDGLRETRDGGRAWMPLGAPSLGSGVPLAVAIADARPGTLYVATARDGVFRSTDGGFRWAPGRGLPQARAGGRPDEIRMLAADPTDADTAYAVHEQHGVYRTRDGGSTWAADNAGLPFPLGRRGPAPRLQFDPDRAGQVYLAFGEPLHSGLVMNRLFRRSGGGEWVPVEVDLPHNTPILGLAVDRAARVLQLWTEDGVWELPLEAKPGSGS
jgi:hypothetical protein